VTGRDHPSSLHYAETSREHRDIPITKKKCHSLERGNPVFMLACGTLKFFKFNEKKKKLNLEFEDLGMSLRYKHLSIRALQKWMKDCYQKL